MGNFRDLKVWQKARDLAVYIYRLTDQGMFSKDFGLKDQIRRADAYDHIEQETTGISSMLTRLIQARLKSPRP